MEEMKKEMKKPRLGRYPMGPTKIKVGLEYILKKGRDRIHDAMPSKKIKYTKLL